MDMDQDGSDSDEDEGLAGDLEDGDFRDESDDEGEAGVPSPSVFDSTELAFIRNGLADVVIPSWVARPPTNLGESSHGKLKADQWLILFTVFLPIILPELWLSSQVKWKGDLLVNFHHLVTCTNIVCSHRTSNTDADIYLNHYTQYRQTAKDIFPRSHSRPNHHYAMHNGELMKFWGPLMNVSEHPYESHNGTLQRIKTNHHMWELDFTMLRNICRRGQLQAMVHDSSLSVME
jgi:hypothetical protein